MQDRRATGPLTPNLQPGRKPLRLQRRGSIRRQARELFARAQRRDPKSGASPYLPQWLRARDMRQSRLEPHRGHVFHQAARRVRWLPDLGGSATDPTVRGLDREAGQVLPMAPREPSIAMPVFPSERQGRAPPVPSEQVPPISALIEGPPRKALVWSNRHLTSRSSLH